MKGGQSLFDKQLSVCQNENYYVLKWNYPIKSKSGSRDIYFTYGKKRSKILNADNMLTTELLSG